MMQTTMKKAWATAIACSALLWGSPALADLAEYGPITETPDAPQRQGMFVWMDLATGDVAAASAFYAQLFGWDIESSPDGIYAWASKDGRPVASIIAWDEGEAGDEGLWVPSIAVTNVNEAVERVTAAGGSIVEAPEDLPGRGRAVLIADPTGAVVQLVRAESGGPLPTKSAGHWLWN